VSAVVPTGTTASIVVNLSSTAVRCVIGVWHLTSGSALASATAAETDPTSLTIASTAGNFVVGTVSAQGGAVTWTGATGRYDTAATGSSRYSGADTVAIGASTVIGIDLSGSVSAQADCGVAYG